MCYQNSVIDRAMESDSGGGPDAPGTDYTTIQKRISQLPNNFLKESVVEAQRLINRTKAELACLVSELDTRELTDIDDSLSTTSWLRHFCRMTASEASGTLKSARALTHMSRVATAALQGQIPHTSLSLLTMARDRHPDEFVAHEEVFADVATYLNPRDLRRAVAHWDQQVDYKRAVDDVEYDAQRRELFFNQTYLGKWDMHGTFGVTDGHVVNTALRGYIQHTYVDQDDHRPMPQRLADAAIGISRFWLDHNQNVPTSGGQKPHITVTIDYKTLIGERGRLPELDGHSIDPETLRQWACDAGIVRIVLDGDSQPIDVGRRTRTIPQSLRRALDHRDRGCVWPGCGAPQSWCDAHHIIHWVDGGDTSLANTQLLCRKHHSTAHRRSSKPENYQPPDP